MKFQLDGKRYWDEHKYPPGWVYEAMGKWAISQLSDDKLYWFFGDEGEPLGYPRRHGFWGDHHGYINTWSRDYHVYTSNASFDEVRGQMLA